MATPIVIPNAAPTLEQCRILLEMVATRASSLKELLLNLAEAEPEDPAQREAIVWSSIYLLETIGALADMGAGIKLFGDITAWTHGTGYDALGKEKQHA